MLSYPLPPPGNSFELALVSVLQQIETPGYGAARPLKPLPGQMFFDTGLGIPIWWNGASGVWVNASGTAT